ncbi:MAG: amidohydrolase family protein [Gammaproteobacteria bacterium]
MMSDAHVITRRDALRLGGMGIAGLAAARLTSPALAQTMGRIDIHHHWHPPPIADSFQGVSIGDSWPGGTWTPERALTVMDRFNIQTGILSTRNPRERVSRELCRQVNEEAARLVHTHPTRFGALAMVPQFDVDAAAAEVSYALDILGLDGVLLNPSVDNRYLGAPEFEPLMDALNQRDAVVLMHPTSPFYFSELSLGYQSSVMEYVFETTRAIANLITSGSIERNPNVRFITAHAGGAAPYIAARLEDQATRNDPQVRERAPEGILHYMKTLYYDTGQATSPYALAALLKLVDSSQVVFGTDLPISPPSLITQSDRVLQSHPELSNEDIQRIERDNAIRLFPRLGE